MSHALIGSTEGLYTSIASFAESEAYMHSENQPAVPKTLDLILDRCYVLSLGATSCYVTDNGEFHRDVPSASAGLR